jgi:UDP-N-acetylmuramoyl-L-alanyl-D-glutamate--2,6-diaminopimelate ligase
VICIDDQWGRRLAGSVALPTMTYGWGEGADWRGALEPGGPPGRSTVAVHGPGGTAVVLEVGLPGDFNAANALGALATAAAAGVAPQAAAAGIGGCPGVPGRMERVSDPDPGRGLVALVDYAHTPDAVSRAVAAVPATARRVVVLGAGGDRDRHKRADMGRAAAETADVVIVTDDNPRSEDPALIRAAVAAGATGAGRARVEVVAGRAAAIEAAVAAARPGDVVLVLGKGHEQGQEIDGVVHDFDDRVALAAALRGGAGP